MNRAHETTEDFKERLAIAARRRRGEGIYSVIGAPRAPECCRRPKPVRDCTAAVESAPDDPPEPTHWCSKHSQGFEAGEDCSECATFAEEMQALEYVAQRQLMDCR